MSKGQEQGVIFEASDKNFFEEYIDTASITPKQVATQEEQALREEMLAEQAERLPYLDLHGYTIAQALTALEHFLRKCRREHCKQILVITGKGTHSEGNIPVLRNSVAAYLQDCMHNSGGGQCVHSFCQAPAHRGGAGAYLVKL